MSDDTRNGAGLFGAGARSILIPLGCGMAMAHRSVCP